MYKNLLFAIALLCSFFTGYGQSDIIISQYIETNSGVIPKGIEIFNVSGVDITFSAGNNLEVYQGTNGGVCSSLINIASGTLLANEVWVIGTSNLTSYATSNGANLSGVKIHEFPFNGNDALQLYLGGTLQDEFGTCGVDPGSSWNSGGVDTQNNNLQIKDAICDGDTSGWSDPSVRFDEIAIGTDMNGFGNAPTSCAAVLSTTCIDENFDTFTGGAPSAGWVANGIGNYSSTGSSGISPNSSKFNTTGDYLETPSVTSPTSLSFWIKGNSTDVTSALLVQGWNGSVWMTIENITNLPTVGTIKTYSSGLSTYSKFKFTYTKSLGNLAFDDVVVTCLSSPAINVSVDAVSLLNYTFGTGPSVAQPFTVSGTDLTDDILLTAPANFEISTSSGSGFSGSLTLTQTGGIVGTTTIYVSLATGLAINTYTGDLDATSTGVTTKNVTFDGEVTCVATHTIASFTPTSGPIGTEVTITGTDFTASSIVDFDGIAATVTYINATTLIAEVPVVTASNYITVTESGCGLNSALNFTIISDNGCVGGSIPAGWTDLMFTGIYDDETDGCHYFELFNPTSSDIDLTDFTLIFDNSFTLGSAIPTTGVNIVPLSGTILAQSTFMVQVTTISGGCMSCPTITPDYTFVDFIGLNVDDRLVLVENYGTGSVAAIDVWQNHALELVDPLFNEGYIFARDVSATAPSTIFSLTDWAYNGNEDCFGFAISSAKLPTINTQPTDVTSCSSADFTVAATAGNGGTLTYQWKYNDGSSGGWTDVDPLNGYFSSPGTVAGATDANLVILGFDVNGYQFYCEVKENLACAVASNAAQVKTQSTTWDGSNWDNGTPDITTVATINGNYNTGTNGSFSACSLIVNDTFSLTVDNTTYVEVENDVTIDGTLVVETQGSFVQNNDNGLFTVNSGGTASVNKTTAPINNWYEYTYWSSPVKDETIGVALALSPPARRFWFKAQNFLDETAETGNNNAEIDGQDGIDDNGDDWQYALAADVMIPGVGYAATQSSAEFSTYDYTFTGPFNNGIIEVPVYRNDAELNDRNSNFIGNPYASAIDVDAFFARNAHTINPSGVLDGIIYFWSHNTAPSNIVNGNEDQNFAQSDYAIINGVAEIAGGEIGEIAGSDGIIPDRYIPSGQGFFTSFSDAASATVESGTIKTGDVIFNNSMRATTGNNQFFKPSNKDKSNALKNKIWMNLTSNNGVFNQLVVAYVDGATNANDGSYYDAKKSVPKGMGAIIYSLIEGSEDKFVIQGKDVKSLNLKEIIYLGLNTSINVPTQYKLSIPKLEGDFVTNQPIYLKDNKFNLYHNLSDSDYSFTAEPGEYNKRFEISFRDGSQPINNLNPHELVIFELNDGNVQFTVNDDLTIKNITILDFLGRNIYTLKGSNYSETYNLSKLSTAMYIAKVELSDGSIIIKKAIKNL